MILYHSIDYKKTLIGPQIHNALDNRISAGSVTYRLNFFFLCDLTNQYMGLYPLTHDIYMCTHTHVHPH